MRIRRRVEPVEVTAQRSTTESVFAAPDGNEDHSNEVLDRLLVAGLGCILVLLTAADARERALRAGAIAPLVELMHGGSDELKEDATACIAALANEAESVEDMARTGAVEALVKAASSSSVLQREAALAAVAVLARRPQLTILVHCAHPASALRHGLERGSDEARL